VRRERLKSTRERGLSGQLRLGSLARDAAEIAGPALTPTMAELWLERYNYQLAPVRREKRERKVY
jgi:hypothetical protein